MKKLIQLSGYECNNFKIKIFNADDLHIVLKTNSQYNNFYYTKKQMDQFKKCSTTICWDIVSSFFILSTYFSLD